MADLSDVLDAFAGLLGAALYPNGTSAPSAIGANCSVFPGWPTANRLEQALKDEEVLVSIFPPPNLERDTTRALSQWLRVTPPVHTITVSVSGSTITIGGPIATPQYVSLIVDGGTYSYPVQANDTPSSVAAALAVLVSRDRTASSAGPILTIPNTHRLVARVGGAATLMKEVERSQRSIMTSIWAPTPALRTAAGRIVRARLSDPKFVGLVDGSSAWVVYDRTNDIDAAEKAELYRRDLMHWVEFGQYVTDGGYEVTLPQTDTDAGAGVPVTTTS